MTDRILLRLEVCQKNSSTAKRDDIRRAVDSVFETRAILCHEGPIPREQWSDPLLDTHVAWISLSEIGDESLRGRTLASWHARLVVDVFRLHREGAAEDDEGEDAVPSFREWMLPSGDFDGVWESLQYETGIKTRLLKYASSAMAFSDARVNPALVAWNRVVLLHGPPGTGKTSLCKGLAHKLAIRLSHRYPLAQLVEVNAHSLFSKWFSESGKLVSRLFSRIGEAVDDPRALVFVLIDEVESLTAARKAAVSGSEPSDAVRAVNALLTQLDQLGSRPNAMVLCTSNLAEAIDAAFVDRADIKAYIGPPSLAARYTILGSCLLELVRAGVIDWQQGQQQGSPAGVAGPAPRFLSPQEAEASARGGYHMANGTGHAEDSLMALEGPSGVGAGMEMGLTQVAEGREARGGSGAGASGVGLGAYPSPAEASAALIEACRLCEGFSGRTLRKLPFLAHANHVASEGAISMGKFLIALHRAAATEIQERASFGRIV